MAEERVDFSLLEFHSYNEYLNSFVTLQDRRYFGNINIAKALVKLGYRSANMPYDEAEFVRRHNLAWQAFRPKIVGIMYFGAYMDPSTTDPVILEFRKREESNLTKVISTIIYVTHRKNDGSDTSAFIDLDESWRNAMLGKSTNTDWRAVFEGRSRVVPKPHHLSYSNPHYNILTYNPTNNFTVLHDHVYGILFMHKGDHKMISVGGAKNKYSHNANRTMVYSPKMGFVIFYDHIVRKKV